MNTTLDIAMALGRMAVGTVLLIAGLGKWRAGSSRFQQAILGYDLVSPAIAKALARVVPRLEMALGSLLLLGLLTRPADVVASALITTFSAAVSWSLVAGRKNHCGCVGFSWQSVQEVQWSLVYRNLALLAVLAGDASSTQAIGIDRLFFPLPGASVHSIWSEVLACSFALTAMIVLAARTITFARQRTAAR